MGFFRDLKHKIEIVIAPNNPAKAPAASHRMSCPTTEVTVRTTCQAFAGLELRRNSNTVALAGYTITLTRVAEGIVTNEIKMQKSKVPATAIQR